MWHAMIVSASQCAHCLLQCICVCGCVYVCASVCESNVCLFMDPEQDIFAWTSLHKQPFQSTFERLFEYYHVYVRDEWINERF